MSVINFSAKKNIHDLWVALYQKEVLGDPHITRSYIAVAALKAYAKKNHPALYKLHVGEK